MICLCFVFSKTGATRERKEKGKMEAAVLEPMEDRGIEYEQHVERFSCRKTNTA